MCLGSEAGLEILWFGHEVHIQRLMMKEMVPS